MDRIMQFFNPQNLPQNLLEIGRTFQQLATQIQTSSGEVEGKKIALERLLECRDWAMRSVDVTNTQQGVGAGQKRPSDISGVEARTTYETK